MSLIDLLVTPSNVTDSKEPAHVRLDVLLFHTSLSYSMLGLIIKERKNIFKMNKEVRMLLPKKELIQVE